MLRWSLSATLKVPIIIKELKKKHLIPTPYDKFNKV